jgi:inner membrane protein
MRWRERVAPTLIAVSCVIATFGLGSALARARLRAALARAAPEQRLIDLASTPPPGNPVCWRALALTLDQRGVYRVHVAGVSLAPAWLDAARCAAAADATTAPLVTSPLASGRDVHFARLFEAPASELRALRERFCDAEALLRYTRVPYWTQFGASDVLGDLRYDRRPGLDFADIVLRGQCHDWIAPWTPPRADLLASPKP